METYHFGQDLLDTYQSMSMLVQILWLVVPPAFLLMLIALILHYLKQQKPDLHILDGGRLYAVRRDNFGRLHLERHLPAISPPQFPARRKQRQAEGVIPENHDML